MIFLSVLLRLGAFVMPVFCLNMFSLAVVDTFVVVFSGCIWTYPLAYIEIFLLK